MGAGKKPAPAGSRALQAKDSPKSGKPSSQAPMAVEGGTQAHMSRAQAQKAAEALLKHYFKVKLDESKSKKQDLLSSGWDYIHVQIGLSKIPQRVKVKPIPIRLPHPLYSAEDDFAMCLIVKEDCKATVKKALDSLKFSGVSQVVGLQELRTDYKEYQERRKLRDAFDLFLVDDRIVALLGKALGKIFFSKKKQPVPVKIGSLLGGKGDPSTVAKRIVAARERTYLYMAHGPCVTVKIARTDFAPAKVAANVAEGVEAVVQHLPGKWKNVMSVGIKTPDSACLPVYNKLPGYLREKALNEDEYVAELLKREDEREGQLERVAKKRAAEEDKRLEQMMRRHLREQGEGEGESDEEDKDEDEEENDEFSKPERAPVLAGEGKKGGKDVGGAVMNGKAGAKSAKPAEPEPEEEESEGEGEGSDGEGEDLEDGDEEALAQMVLQKIMARKAAMEGGEESEGEEDEDGSDEEGSGEEGEGSDEESVGDLIKELTDKPLGPEEKAYLQELLARLSGEMGGEGEESESEKEEDWSSGEEPLGEEPGSGEEEMEEEWGGSEEGWVGVPSTPAPKAKAGAKAGKKGPDAPVQTKKGVEQKPQAKQPKVDKAPPQALPAKGSKGKGGVGGEVKLRGKDGGKPKQAKPQQRGEKTPKPKQPQQQQQGGGKKRKQEELKPQAAAAPPKTAVPVAEAPKGKKQKVAKPAQQVNGGGEHGKAKAAPEGKKKGGGAPVGGKGKGKKHGKQ